MFKQRRENIILEINDIRALSKISPWRSVVAVLTEWLIIAAAIAINENLNHPAVYLIVWVIIGSRMYALYSLLHDGIHYLLFSKRQTNDWLCRLFLAWPLFISLHKIRRFHLAHHQYLKTPDDPEALHLEYSEFQFPKSARALAFIFIKDVTGINFVFYKSRKVLKYASLLFRKTSADNKKTVITLLKPESGMIIYYLVVGSILLYTGAGFKFIVYWIIPYITVYQLLNRLRLSTEHFHLPEDKLFQTRTVKLNFVEQFLFSPHNLGFHTEHHLYPSVPFYHLPSLHQMLMNAPEFRKNILINESYTTVIKKYIK